MNWKLPDALQKSVDYFKPGSKGKKTSPIVNEDEDHLGIQQVERHSPAPFRRVESTFHSYVDIALSVELERLQRHQTNIKKWRRLKDYPTLRSEYEKAAITVKQIMTIISDIENLRAKVVESDHSIFNKRLAPVKARSMTAIEKFISICNENDDCLSGSLNRNVPPAAITTGKGDLEAINPFDQEEPSGSGNSTSGTSDVGFTYMRGNRLVIDPIDAPQSFCEPDFSNNIMVQDFVPENESYSAFNNEKQSELVVEKENPEIDESWKKLEKDMTELHEMMKDFSKVVYEQGKTVNDISENVEKAGKNVKEGNKELHRATVLKAAMFPVFGAVVGGAIGGPIGMVAGFKLGSMTTGLAAVGVTGTVLGYQGGKVLKKRQEENSMEMKEMRRKRKESESSDSFEFLENDQK